MSGTAPSAELIREMAEKALGEIPEPLRGHVRGIAILVEEFADEETLDSLDIGDPFELLGLYHGVSMDRKSVHDVAGDLDRIFLYRRPLLDFWCAGDDSLEDVVRNTLIHEIGHHFGLSDDDMHRLESE